MRWILRSLLFVAAALASLEMASADQGGKTVDLLAGDSLDGWDVFLADTKVKKEDVWSVKDGVLVCKGEPLGYLYTKQQFKNFKLTLQWRWAPGKEPGNSGVLLRITGKAISFLPKCAEAQLKSGSRRRHLGLLRIPADRRCGTAAEDRKSRTAGQLPGCRPHPGQRKRPRPVEHLRNHLRPGPPDGGRERREGQRSDGLRRSRRRDRPAVRRRRDPLPVDSGHRTAVRGNAPAEISGARECERRVRPWLHFTSSYSLAPIPLPHLLPCRNVRI